MSEDYELEESAGLFLLIITLAGGVLRVLLLDAKGLWLDETFSIWLANQNIPDLLGWVIKIDQHPPLYYLLLNGWVALNGDAAYSVRLLSALLGTATIPIVYLIGSRLSGALVGLAAAILLALSPINVYYSQETRMYALLAFVVAAAVYALVRLLTDPHAAHPIGGQLRGYRQALRAREASKAESAGEFSYEDKSRSQNGWRSWFSRRRWSSLRLVETDLAWIGFVLFSAAALWTHNTAVLFLLAVNLFVLGLLIYQRVRPAGTLALQAPSLANWIKAQIAILLLWSPWLVPFVQQVRRVDQQFWIPAPTITSVAGTVRSLLNGSRSDFGFPLVMVGLLCALLVLGLVYYRKRLSIFLLLAALIAVPFVGELVVSLRRPIFSQHTLIWITIPLLLLVAAGIAQLRYRLLMLLVLGAIVTNYLFTDGDYFRFYRKEDWATPAGYVAYYAEENDLVLFNSNFVVIPFDYYFEQYEDLYSIKVIKQGLPLDLYEDGVLEPKMTAGDIPQLVDLVSDHDRVWLVYSHDHYTDPQGLIPQTLAQEKELTQTREFYGGRVELYETPS